jgi:GT2 family glycosyltransferase
VTERRYLLGILVYNGRDVVPRCLDSAASVVSPNCDVVVFDDHSPSEGWSAEVARMCADRSIGYYCSPRNLGIPRNMSLLMKTAVEGGYDVVGLVNSDVVLPANLLETMDAAFDADPMIGSITPWSNNVSAFSLPMSAGGLDIAQVAFVDQLAASLFALHGGRSMEVPTGVGYCLLVPTDVVRRVGVMDPIFGRGYCEEVDWCQRLRLAGFKNVLSLGSFVYHEGSGTNRDEGLLAHGMTTVVEHELIIRGRYPDYVERVDEFLRRPELGVLGRESIAHSLPHLIAGTDYRLVLGDPNRPTTTDGRTITLSSTGALSQARISVFGMQTIIDIGDGFHPDALVEAYGLPRSVVVVEAGAAVDLYVSWARRNGVDSVEHLSYPTRV